MEETEKLVGNESVVEVQQEVKEFKKPVKVVRTGKISINVWENKIKDGKTFFSLTLQKSYKVGEEWKNVNSFNKSDLPEIAFACAKAYNEVEDLINA